MNRFKNPAYFLYVIFFAFFCVAFTAETLGLPMGRNISFFIVCLMPAMFCLINVLKIDRLHISKLLFGGIALFLILIAISAFFSNNLQTGLIGLLFYSGLFAGFFIALQGKQFLEEKILKLLLFFTFFFPVFGIITRNFIYPFWKVFIPTTGYELVYPKFGLHNHMGDFLALMMPILTLKFLSTQKWRYLLLELFLLPYLIYAYSRTAYLTFIALTFIVFFVERKVARFFPVFLFSLILLFVILFFSLTIQEKEIYSPISFEPFKSTFFIKQKPLWSFRIEFLSEAFKSIREKPLWGVGFYNFTEASKKYTSIPPFSTESSHNLFVDVIVEHGIPAGIVFLFLILIILKRVEKKGLFFIVSLGLLINFQTDYTHRIYAIFLLFFLSLGLGYKSQSR